MRVVDADTCICDIDLGFSVWMRKVAIRLDGLDAPELKTPEGPIAAAALTTTILGKEVTLRTRKDATEKFGRMLGTLLLADGTNVNMWLIAHGYARPYAGGKR